MLFNRYLEKVFIVLIIFIAFCPSILVVSMPLSINYVNVLMENKDYFD